MRSFRWLTLGTALLYGALHVPAFGEAVAPMAAKAPEPRLRLATVVHGIAFDQGNNPVRLDGPNIVRIQADLIQQLRARLDRKAVREFDAAAKVAAERAGGKEGNVVYANAIQIASLLHKLRPADQATFETLNIKLLTRYGLVRGASVRMTDLVDGRRPPWVDATLEPAFRDLNLAGLFNHFPPFRYTYAARCRQAGVPVPPPLNVSSPSGGWVNAGEQKVSYLEPPNPATGHPNKFSQMFYWIPSNNSGICIANPIVEDKLANPNSINAFGVICQSLAQPGKPSQACYWDNRPDDMALNAPHDVNNTSDFNAPPVLPANNQCTDCHAGGHSYIVFPNLGISDPALQPSAIEVALKAFDAANPAANFHNQENWFVPHVDASWPQNTFTAYPPGPSTDPNDASTCGACHGPNGGFIGKTLPNVSGAVLPRDNLYKFCSFVLPNFLTAVHDPANYYDGTMQAQAAFAPNGVTALYDACLGNTFQGLYFPSTQAAWLVHRDPP